MSATILLAACGGDSSVPDGAAVKVRDTAIEQTTLNHYLTIYARDLARQQQAQTGSTTSSSANVVLPTPPDYAACVAAKTKAAAKGKAEKPSVYKTQCKTDFENLRAQVVPLLITSAWLEGEAADQGIKISETATDKLYADWKKANFPKAADYKKFIDQTGYTLADIRRQLRVNEFSNKLQKKIVDAVPKPTDKAIAAYYDKNKASFGQPERRDLRIVLAKSKAEADKAHAALAAGQSWKTVAKKYSIDQATKNVGGVLLAVAKGVQEKSLDDAVFKAPVNKLSAPLKTQFGYYVYEVTKINQASQQSLDQAKKTISATLTQERSQKNLTAFGNDLEKKWRAKTVCASPYKVSACKNGPKATATTATTPTAAG